MRPLPWTWLPRRIGALDPETDYDEVMRLLAEHQLNLPIVNLTLLVTTAQTALPPTPRRPWSAPASCCTAASSGSPTGRRTS